MIAIKLKSIYSEMEESKQHIRKHREFEQTRLNILSELEELEYEIDALPETEKEPKGNNDTEIQSFNEKLVNARELKNKIIDIYDLLYSAVLSRNWSYYKEVIDDPALTARIDNIILRAESNGNYIPLSKEYINLPLPITREEAEVNIE